MYTLLVDLILSILSLQQSAPAAQAAMAIQGAHEIRVSSTAANPHIATLQHLQVAQKQPDTIQVSFSKDTRFDSFIPYHLYFVCLNTVQIMENLQNLGVSILMLIWFLKYYNYIMYGQNTSNVPL